MRGFLKGVFKPSASVVSRYFSQLNKLNAESVIKSYLHRKRFEIQFIVASKNNNTMNVERRSSTLF